MIIFVADPALVALGIAGIILLGVAWYYAFSMLFWMHGGKLEKSWRYLSTSIIVLTMGVLVFALNSFVANKLMMLLTLTGSAIMLIGTFLMLLGFRSHYRFWSGTDLQDKEKNRIEP